MNKIEKLIEEYIESYNDYLNSKIEYPDEADDDWFSFRSAEKEILEFFGLKQEKMLFKPLYSFIEESCFENKIESTNEIINKIVYIMKKIEEIQPYIKQMDLLFINEYEKINNAQSIDSEKLPNEGGIYVIYKGNEPIYVGRTDDIKERIKHHIKSYSRNGSATFAFNLAKRDFEKQEGVIIITRKKHNKGIDGDSIKKTRKELEKDPIFKPLFDARKKYLADCKFRFISIENDLIQTMLEPYLAYKLGTYPINNAFENH